MAECSYNFVPQNGHITHESPSRLTEQMLHNLQQAGRAWLASETQDETIRRHKRKGMFLPNGRSSENAS
jgi:hypothetical protein